MILQNSTRPRVTFNVLLIALKKNTVRQNQGGYSKGAHNLNSNEPSEWRSYSRQY
jgi:hypothetical protein